MTRGRFALSVALASLMVGAGSFALGLQVLDDGKPDPPPRRSGVDAVAPPTDGTATSETTASSTTLPVAAPGELETPVWVAIVASEGSQAEAEDVAADVAAAGYPAGVLRSDDYDSLSSGHWVAYAGPFADADLAGSALDDLAGDGFDGAYVRCVGSKKECDDAGKGRGNDGGGDD
ncbi:MAG: SPOR domain-containing protein [Actinomycetota bacterium]